MAPAYSTAATPCCLIFFGSLGSAWVRAATKFKTGVLFPSFGLLRLLSRTGRGGHSRQLLSKRLKQVLNINPDFRTSLHKMKVQLGCKGLSFLCIYLSLVAKINFVSDKEDYYVFTSDLASLLDPTSHALKTLLRRNIVNNDGD